MEIKYSKNNGVSIVSVNGKMDTYAAEDFESGMLKILELGDSRIIIDFSNVDFISSAGLRVLIMVAKKLKAVNGVLYLASFKSYLKEMLDTVGFTSIFNIFPSVDEAIKNLPE